MDTGTGGLNVEVGRCGAGVEGQDFEVDRLKLKQVD